VSFVSLQSTVFKSYGGIQTYNRLVLRVLNELENSEPVYALIAEDSSANFSVAEQSPLYSRLRLEGFNGNRVRFVRRIMNLGIGNKIDLLLVGHVNYAPLGLMLRYLRPRLRYGVVIHGTDVWGKLSFLRRRALQNADFIISVSEDTKRRAVEVNRAPADRISLLPNALQWDTTDLTPQSASFHSGIRLLSVCRLDSNERLKGVDTVISCLPKVLAQVPDVQYLIVGGGDDLQRHKELACAAGVAKRVQFLDSIDDAALQASYQSCDVFVMPSAQEGFGIVYLEAMRYGKPVVAANFGGVPEVVQDGITGSLVEYGNEEQLARVLIELCQDPARRQRLGAAGFQRLQEKFTFVHFRQALVEILRRELPITLQPVTSLSRIGTAANE
jgi:phosphatidylinositol alpha-1,6-mannosyltransferase